MKVEVLERDAILFKPDDISECLFIIQDGLVELSTTMDNGTEFIIETVGRGVALNAITFLLEDKLNITARCHTTVTFFVINKANFTKIISQDDSLKKYIKSYLDRIIEEEKSYDMDITCVKKEVKTYDSEAIEGYWRGQKALQA